MEMTCCDLKGSLLAAGGPENGLPLHRTEEFLFVEISFLNARNALNTKRTKIES
jgi:hypothetical protein